MKRFIALVLSLVMALSLCVPAYAEGEVEQAATGGAITTQEALNEAVANGGEITLGAGKYTFPSISEKCTITCEEGVVFEGSSGLNIAGSTVIGATFSNPSGNAVGGTINGIFKNCTFDGKNALRYCYAGETVEFYDCVFTGDVYGIHFDGGANDAYFEDCTFSGFNAMGSALTMLTMEGCTFKANGRSGYNGINLWGSTEMTDCTFVFDGSVAYEWCDLCGDNKTCTFTNCVVTDDTTTKSVATVIGDYGEGNSLTVDSAVDANGKYTGGFFNTDPTANVAAGYAVKKTDAMYEVYKLENKDAATTTTTTTGTTTTIENVVTNSSASSTIIDVSVAEDTKTVEMSAAAAAEVFPTTDAKPVEIVTTEASISFDADAAEKIGTNANAAAVTLTVEVEVAPAAADAENTDAFEEVMANAGQDSAVLLSIDMKAGSNEIFSETNAAGTATVKVQLPAGLTSAKVYYLDGDDAVYLDAYVADANGYIYVELEHFSQYVILAGTPTPASSAKGAYYSTDMTTLAVHPGCDLDNYTYSLEHYVSGNAAAKSFDQKALWSTNKVTKAKVIEAVFVVAASAESADYAFVNGSQITYLSDVADYTGTVSVLPTVDAKDAAKCGEMFVGGDYAAYTDANGKLYVEKAGGTVYNVGGKYVELDQVTVAGGDMVPCIVDTLQANPANYVDYVLYVIGHEYGYDTVTVKGKTTVTNVFCKECKASFEFVEGTEAEAIAKFGAGNYNTVAAKLFVAKTAGYTGGTVVTPSTDKVTSAETFDAGIAMYVGMSVMAAAGSAVVLKKKD